METKPFSLQSPESIAKEYGGNKQAIARAAQMGMLDPTAAVLAGMFIDRMRSAAVKEQAPNQTVAQEVLSAQPPMGAPVQGMPQGQMGVPSPNAPQVARGLEAIDVPEDMYNEDSFAGGGIVAFQDGGQTSPFERSMKEWIDTQRQSVADRTPGMAGAWSRPLVEPEELERMRLRQMLEQKYGGKGSVIQGFFTRQSPEERAQAMDILNKLPSMSLDEMRAVAGGNLSLQPSTAAAPTAPGAPMTVADLNAMEGNIDRNLRLMPGLTLDQSAANIDAARKDTQAGAQAAAPAGSGVQDMYPMFKMPRDMTPEEFIAQQRAFGIPEDPLADARAKIASMAGESQLDREYAKNMALVQAGLSIAGGTSPNAIQNIAKGSMAGIEQYAKDVKDIKAAEKDLFKMQTEIAKADDARKRGDFEGFQKANERANDLAIKLRRAESEERQVKAYEKQASRPTEYDRNYNLYLQHTREVGEKPTAQGFQRFMLGARASTVMTMEDAIRIATQQLSAGAIEPPSMDAIRQRARELMVMAGNQAPGGPDQGKYQEGQKAKDRLGKPIVFRNGQWVYE